MSTLASPTTGAVTVAAPTTRNARAVGLGTEGIHLAFPVTLRTLLLRALAALGTTMSSAATNPTRPLLTISPRTVGMITMMTAVAVAPFVSIPTRSTKFIRNRHRVAAVGMMRVGLGFLSLGQR